MLATTLRGIRMASSFWGKGPKKTHEQDIEEAAKGAANLSYMVKKIMKTNESKPKVLTPQLPKYQGKLTVVLEMDQVLMYAFAPDQEGYLLAPLRNYDFYAEYEEYEALLSIYKRKNLDNFINYLSEECEPILWSTGVPSYVELVMNLIDPHKKIPYVLTQNECDHVENTEQEIDIYVKDLNLLGRDLSRVVYLDGKPMSYWMYPQNCYPLEEFRADMTMETEDLNLMILELESLKE